MQLTVHIAETIRSVIKNIPKTVVTEKQRSITLRQLSVEIGIPPILIVFAVVNGVKKSLDEDITGDADIHFFGTMSGG
jgi:hypothetical protein